jgi:XTP/dITP diphosphohydrolase
VEISRQVPGLVLSDDSGLEVDALGGEPGVYSARYAGEDGNDGANNAKLLKELDGIESRAARFRCVMVLAENGEVLADFSGAVEGRIIHERQGQGGFGYDPLFVPDGHDQTFAELGEDVKNKLSHRASAMEKVVTWLAERSNG